MRRIYLLLLAVIATFSVGATAVAQTTDSSKPGEHQAGDSQETDTAEVSAAELRWESVLMRKAANPQPRIHVVQPSEKLGDIAKQYNVLDENGDGDYLRLFYANPDIKDPNIIEPGWKVRIPLPSEKLEVREVPRPIAPRGPPTAGGGNTGATAPPAWQGDPPDHMWDTLAGCESGGNWASTVGKYEGGLQFLNSTWLGYGGGEFAQHAYEASREQQIEIARRAWRDRGWAPWPKCTRDLGWRQ